MTNRDIGSISNWDVGSISNVPALQCPQCHLVPTSMVTNRGRFLLFFSSNERILCQNFYLGLCKDPSLFVPLLLNDCLPLLNIIFSTFGNTNVILVHSPEIRLCLYCCIVKIGKTSVIGIINLTLAFPWFSSSYLLSQPMLM